MTRIDEIAQNGNDGLVYQVEAICRIIAGEHTDMRLTGKNAGKLRWEMFIPMAMKILEITNVE